MEFSNLELFATIAASINYIDVHEPQKLGPETKKISRKRHISSDNWTFEKIKALSPRALVNRFAEIIADDINKKYYYHCRLVPGCTHTEFSYGSAEKACNRMKKHLKAHLSEEGFEFHIVQSPPSEEMRKRSNLVKMSPKVPTKAEFNTRRTPDHNYAARSRSSRRTNNCNKIPEITVHRQQQKEIQKQFVIKTPAFPYLHEMEEYVVAGIVELDVDGTTTKRRQRSEVDCLDIENYMLSEMKKKKPSSVTPDSCELLPICDRQDVTGLILGSVENTARKKHTAACASKIPDTFSNADENVENRLELDGVPRASKKIKRSTQ